MNSIDDIETKIKDVFADLHLVFINIKSYELLLSSEGAKMCEVSPSFVNSYLFSAMNTNILVVANLLDDNQEVLSLNKLVNIIERNKKQIEIYTKTLKQKYMSTNNKDLKQEISDWRDEISKLRNSEIGDMVVNIRNNISAHKNNSFKEKDINDNSFYINDLKVFVTKIFELVNDIHSSVFYSGYVLLEDNDADLSQILKIVNKSIGDK